ncbi:WW domain-containing adapter protein with coiled-coil-like isoform X2 [Oppia nitens]|nr:WW domain-containing adapter protein with coiled-coil-like isoform X2 [Oppia nitens]
MSKYSSKSFNSFPICNDSSHGKHRRTYSPTNGSNSRSRSVSPDNWSPNRSVYGNKSYTRSKDRDRDRDRERDKYYENRKKIVNSRTSRSRSPVESKHEYSKSVNNHSSHDLNNDHKSSSNRNNNNNSITSFRGWREQKSSTGKIYYYNSRRSISQWEKPQEWMEYERRHSSKSSRHSLRDRSDKNHKSHSNELSTQRDKTEKDSSRSKYSGTAGTDSTSSNSNSSSSIRSHSRRDDEFRPSSERITSIDSKRVQLNDTKNNVLNCVKREPLHSPYESSNTVLNNNKTNSNNQTNDINRTQGISCTNNYNNNSGSAQQLLNQISQPLSPTQTQNLQKLILSNPSLAELSRNISEEALRAIQQALQLTVKATDSKSQNSQLSRHRNDKSSPRNASTVSLNSESPVSTSERHLSHHHHRHHHHNQHHHNQHHSHYNQLQHQSADGIRQELDLLISRSHINKSPNSEKSAISSTRHDSPPSSVTNISTAISSASLKPSVPSVPALTPSLANYFRDDLVTHVTGWQAEHAEKQAKMYSMQSHDIGSLQCTRVSAELKMARSLVRLTEIQSTLQEQRIIFARQQIKNVEEWKGQNSSQTSYHS